MSASHPKLAKLREILTEFFRDEGVKKNKSKAIVFTGFKASALEIKRFLDSTK